MGAKATAGGIQRLLRSVCPEQWETLLVSVSCVSLLSKPAEGICGFRAPVCSAAFVTPQQMQSIARRQEFLSQTGSAQEAAANASQSLLGVWDGFLRENTSSYLVDSQRTSVGGVFHSKYVLSPSPRCKSYETVRFGARESQEDFIGKLEIMYLVQNTEK